MSDDPEQAFARKLLTLIVAAGDDGMELQELVAATGRSVEEVKDMLQRLQAGGYLQPPHSERNGGKIMGEAKRKKHADAGMRAPDREKEFVASVHALHRRLGMTQEFRKAFAELIRAYLDIDHIQGHIGYYHGAIAALLQIPRAGGLDVIVHKTHAEFDWRISPPSPDISPDRYEIDRMIWTMQLYPEDPVRALTAEEEIRALYRINKLPDAERRTLIRSSFEMLEERGLIHDSGERRHGQIVYVPTPRQERT
jgi:hypothetical protein